MFLELVMHVHPDTLNDLWTYIGLPNRAQHPEVLPAFESVQ
jgi:hypothetical protein